jgi:hypothetical protein
MAIQIVSLADGQLGTSEADLYGPATEKRAILKGIRLVNSDTAARTVNLYFRPNGGSTSRLIFPKDLTLAAGAAFIDDSEITLQAGDKIRGKADTAAKVDFVLSGVERDEV